jgi:hypothetical protein
MNDVEKYTAKEAGRRRDEVIRRMANTAPQPKATSHQKNKKKAVAGRAVRKIRARREG